MLKSILEFTKERGQRTSTELIADPQETEMKKY